jgi:hypothetical protein
LVPFSFVRQIKEEWDGIRLHRKACMYEGNGGGNTCAQNHPRPAPVRPIHVVTVCVSCKKKYALVRRNMFSACWNRSVLGRSVAQKGTCVCVCVWCVKIIW